MPLYQTVEINNRAQILIWKISEDPPAMESAVSLNPNSLSRIANMKSQQHRLGFMSVRRLLQHAGYSDFDLIYDHTGKPHLTDGRHISISHSHGFSAIILSDTIAGIDLELKRDKIIRIADKFCDCEFSWLDSSKIEDYVAKLTIIWGVKEAIFKIRNEEGISFKDHIEVLQFDLNSGVCTAKLNFGGSTITYDCHFIEVENYILVYAFQD
ncbi:MAG: 4'-phosphopantetheinyl transferase superfamily protein [Flavobacterium sp.]|nr:MAG: 4'-phosphopantetheinyl transferase superfamily protein [Flavobacterium sp.]